MTTKPDENQEIKPTISTEDTEDTKETKDNDENKTKSISSFRCYFLLTPEEVQQIEKYLLVRETVHTCARRLLLTYLEELKIEHRSPSIPV